MSDFQVAMDRLRMANQARGESPPCMWVGPTALVALARSVAHTLRDASDAEILARFADLWDDEVGMYRIGRQQ